MDFTSQLKKFGLSEKQAAVYLGGLKTGTDTASNIAKSANVKRGTIYGIINELKGLGLCKNESRTKKRKTFTMSDPNELFAIQNERDYILQTIVPMLRKFTHSTYVPKISIYEGKEDVKKIYEDTLKNNPQKEICSVSSVDSVMDFLGQDWVDKYVQLRMNNKINNRLITTNYRLFDYYSHLDKKHMRETKYLPKGYPLGIDIELYNKRILLTSISENPFAVLIEDDKVYMSMKSLFEYIWQTL